MQALDIEPIAAVRAFNRFYTGVIGVLEEHLLASPYSLTEARVIFELAQRESTEVRDLRATLAIDPGYLSRILARFEADGLVARERSPADARRQTIRLTRRGRAAFTQLDGRSSAQIEELLTPLDACDRQRLLTAMDAIRRVLEPDRDGGRVVLRELRAGDYGWIVQRHGAIYADEYGWDETFEALVARIVADFVDERDPQRERAWMAEVDGEPAGCVLCVGRDDATAQLRLLLVEPRMRGAGIGTRLIDECVGFARDAGYRAITLWTNDVLRDARRLYERAGFELVEEEPHHSFGRDLVGQNWRLELRTSASAASG